MWNEPYLETCCRAALHRLYLSGSAGRPAGAADQTCLRRLAAMKLTSMAPDGSCRITPDGIRRHAMEIDAASGPPDGADRLSG